MKPTGRARKRGSALEQDAIRSRAMAALRKGMSVPEIMRAFGVSQSAVYGWKRSLATSSKSTERVAQGKKRGRRHGLQRRLSPAQEAKLKRWVIDSTPDQLKLNFMLWERKAVAELVMRKFNIDLPLSTVGCYLQRWGLTTQRPATRYYEKQPEAVKKWLDEDYPAIVEEARRDNAEIQWADEAGPTTGCAAGAKGYAKPGATPLLKRKARTERINYISSVTNQGKARYLIYKTNFTAKVFIKFLGQIVRGSKGRKVIMIVDNLRVHHSKEVAAWLEGKEHLIVLKHLPAYSPELNPSEYLNHDLKTNVHRRGMPRTKRDLERNVRAHLKKVASSPKRVKSYFQAKHVQYAA